MNKYAQGMANIMPGSMPHPGIGGYQLTDNNDSYMNDQDAIDIVTQIANTYDPDKLMYLKDRAKEYINSGYKFNTPGANEEWIKLVNTLEFNSRPSHLTKEMKTPQEIAKRLLNMFREQQRRLQHNIHGAKNMNNKYINIKISQSQNVNRRNQEDDEEDEEEKTKKKHKRGNPFRVLMGRVGKLLDHGMGKSDIVRYLSRHMPYFNEETIRKAVDIVKDYNRKKHRKQSYEENKFTRIAYRNYDGKSIYSVEPEWEKRSSGELMARAAWLKWLLKYNPSLKMADGKNAEDIVGAETELRKIRNALRIRGWDDNEIP